MTGLRNPCVQIDQFKPGLLKQVVRTNTEGLTVRKAGVMAVVTHSGVVRSGDRIEVELPTRPFEELSPV